jgi:hypothetical protein
MTQWGKLRVNNVDPCYALELARWGILHSKAPHLKALGETLLSYTTLYLLSPRLPMLPYPVAVALNDLKAAKADFSFGQRAEV